MSTETVEPMPRPAPVPDPIPLPPPSSSPHGTRSRYVNGGCTCELCRIANTFYQRTWEQNRRARGGAR